MRSGVENGLHVMRNLKVFNQVSLDGYFVDGDNSMDWAHRADPEWSAFTAENASGEAELLFGRVTYDQMAAWWPSPQAAASMPDVAAHMNAMPKVVFSRTMAEAAWDNTRVAGSENLVAEVRSLKTEEGPAMVLMGSGSIVAQLAAAGLVDEYQLVVNPLVLGSGRTLFDGLSGRVPLTLTDCRSFKNGNVVLCYRR